MDEIDKKIIGNRKNLYDDTIKYDESNLANQIKKYIEELKKI